MRFDNIGSDIEKALAGLGYTEATEVQRAVVPLVLAEKDVVVKAQTGSGKTASFAIPICELVDWNENKPQALILEPTRELAVQVKEDFTNIGRFKRIKATAIFGKSPFAKQKLELKQKSHVVVGTPGRTLDHIEKGTLSLEKVRYLVIDEADEMLNMGFIEQVEAIIQSLPKNRVTMLFSATLPTDIAMLSDKYMKAPQHVEIAATGLTTVDITHEKVTVKDDRKMVALRDTLIVHNPESAIIFCRTQERVDDTYDQLRRMGYPTEKIHGGLTQEDRFGVMNDFKRGMFRFLVATDVAARGIDIENISLVVNYDVPLEKESYVHRTGRTGRAGRSGKAITFVTPFENRFIGEIEEYIGFEIPQVDLPNEAIVSARKPAFDEKMEEAPVVKKDKSAALSKDIMKIYFNGGKKKKLRAVDFVGTIAKLDGVSADDIGIITIEDNVSFVEILNGKGAQVVKAMQTVTVKGKKLKVSKARR
ncbi:ATP-dependent RNA helicase [Listeria grandensis FSL F6-0971]|uniref:ATP-dependent RNA helicase DbpA n=1 Tax=Listeria grandensis FSL F6-0971 TaxID=1265819 RepID=W7AY15_9LIST|nr:DEAD/DEAH box helicase [Listeria grandensis]EUJ18512.1 ATP-dependent RNA helicase [Listeria grandensis FSL F6-0971]